MTRHSLIHIECLCGKRYQFEAIRGTYTCKECSRLLDWDWRPRKQEAAPKLEAAKAVAA